MCGLAGAQRQAKGGCVAGLQLLCCHPLQPLSQGGEQRHLYTFRQLPAANSSSSSEAGASSSSQQLQGMSVAAGDCLILGADGVQTNIGRVDVVEVIGRTITVASRKPLQLERYTAAASQQKQQQPVVNQQEPAGAAAADAGSTGLLTWRLDQDEAASTAMQQRANVLRLAADSSSSRAVWLRRLIIELAAPRQLAAVTAAEQSQQQGAAQQQGQGAAQQQQQQQKQQDEASHAELAAAVASLDAGPAAGPAVRLAMAAGRAYVKQHGRQLNSDQVAVLRRVLSLQDYCLVLGMPGEADVRLSNLATAAIHHKQQCCLALLSSSVDTSQ
jgi:hypothetical protein